VVLRGRALDNVALPEEAEAHGHVSEQCAHGHEVEELLDGKEQGEDLHQQLDFEVQGSCRLLAEAHTAMAACCGPRHMASMCTEQCAHAHEVEGLLDGKEQGEDLRKKLDFEGSGGLLVEGCWLRAISTWPWLHAACQGTWPVCAQNSVPMDTKSKSCSMARNRARTCTNSWILRVQGGCWLRAISPRPWHKAHGQ
jgi:hypothetical protein